MKYYLGDQVEKNEMGRTRSTYGGEMCIQDFGGQTCGKPIGRPRGRCKDNSKMDLQEVG